MSLIKIKLKFKELKKKNWIIKLKKIEIWVISTKNYSIFQRWGKKIFFFLIKYSLC